MKLKISELPAGAAIEVAGNLATVIVGDVTFKSQIAGDELVLFPDRSVRQRDFLKMIGRIADD